MSIYGIGQQINTVIPLLIASYTSLKYKSHMLLNCFNLWSELTFPYCLQTVLPHPLPPPPVHHFRSDHSHPQRLAGPGQGRKWLGPHLSLGTTVCVSGLTCLGWWAPGSWGQLMERWAVPEEEKVVIFTLITEKLELYHHSFIFNGF